MAITPKADFPVTGLSIIVGIGAAPRLFWALAGVPECAAPADAASETMSR